MAINDLAPPYAEYPDMPESMAAVINARRIAALRDAQKNPVSIFGPILKRELTLDFSHALREAFLEELRTHGIPKHAIKALRLNRTEVYRLRFENEDFRAAWDDAMTLGIEAQEDEMRRRAYEGVNKPVYHQGQVVGTVREYSDTIAMFLMRGAKPEKYRERLDVNANVDASATLKNASDQELNKLIFEGLTKLGVRVRRVQTYENGQSAPTMPANGATHPAQAAPDNGAPMPELPPLDAAGLHAALASPAAMLTRERHGLPPS